MMQKRTFVPKYKKLYDKLLDEIRADFKKGDLFYSQRDLMKNLDASYATVSHILNDLKKAEVIETHIGKGIFIRNIPEFTDKNTTITVFLDDGKSAGFFNSPVYGLYHRALVRAERKRRCKIDYQIVDRTEKDAFDIFKASGSSGILFIEERFPGLSALAVRENIPYAVIHPTVSKFDYSVDIDDVHGVKACMDAMIEKGSSKILFIGSDMEKGHNCFKLEGYKTALELHDIPFDKSLCIDFPHKNISNSVSGIIRMLSENIEFDGVLAASPEYIAIIEENLSLISRKRLRKMNFAVIGSYITSNSTTGGVNPGVLELPYDKAVDMAMDMIIRKINNPHLPPQRILLRPEFRWGHI